MDLYKEFKAQKVLDQIPAGQVLVAVSGGGDSVCLLHCVKRVAKEKGWFVTAVHIQHGLRGKDSLKDEAFVQALARKWGLAFESREIRPPKKSATEEKSRLLRYTQLGEAARKFASPVVLTAHNAQDQTETFFLNLLRGSGSDGLCGMPESRPLSGLTGQSHHKDIQVVRPFLSFSRKDIEAYARSQGLTFRTDRSNLNLKYRRNWMRREVIPLLEKVQPRLVERIAVLTRLMREQKVFLDSEIGKMESHVVRWGADGEHLDLTRFFEYNEFLRGSFLHRLKPKSSYREIGEIAAFLKKRKRSEIISLPK